MVSSAFRDGMELICVTLNDGNDWKDHKEMLDYGFEKFKVRAVYKKGAVLGKNKVPENIYVCLKDKEKFKVEIKDEKVYVIVNGYTQNIYDISGKTGKEKNAKHRFFQNFNLVFERMINI
ncbi:hypothetical protein [Treponema sp. R6D11]